MTQLKDNDFSINLDDLDISDLGLTNEDDTITINLDDTYGATTTYWTGNSIGEGTISIDTNTLINDTVDIEWIYNNMNIDPNEVERMCQEYPSLEKTWRNFKSVYDMVKQDWEGKKKAGEIDDDIPF